MPQANLEAFYAAGVEFHSPNGKCFVHFCRNRSDCLRQSALLPYHLGRSPSGIPFGMRPFSGLKISGLIYGNAFANPRATISLNEIQSAQVDDFGLHRKSSLFAIGSNLSAPPFSFGDCWQETFSGGLQFEQVNLPAEIGRASCRERV